MNFSPRQLFWLSSARVWCNAKRPGALKAGSYRPPLAGPVQGEWTSGQPQRVQPGLGLSCWLTHEPSKKSARSGDQPRLVMEKFKNLTEHFHIENKDVICKKSARSGDQPRLVMEKFK